MMPSSFIVSWKILKRYSAHRRKNLPTSKTPALDKLTPEKRKKVLDLAAEMTVLNHVKKLVEDMRVEATNSNSSSSERRTES
ncbi:hypothetical protein SAMN05216316_1267 [Nitrosovibrio sp. Nv6]|nr:hypothetical protein SAMN05216316_1267 [Nitrosovibrio sp. Nv6]